MVSEKRDKGTAGVRKKIRARQRKIRAHSRVRSRLSASEKRDTYPAERLFFCVLLLCLPCCEQVVIAKRDNDSRVSAKKNNKGTAG